MPIPLYEVVAMRTETAKHWLNNDGSYTATISMVPIHYEDESGMWQNVDTSIVDPVAVALPKQPINKTLHKNGGWAHSAHFTTPYNKSDIRLPKNIKSGYSIGFGEDRLTFTPVNASPSLGQVDPNDLSSIDYQDVWVDTDLILKSLVDGVKEEIILKSNNSPTTFSFKVDDGPLADDFTSGSIKLIPPWYEDASGTRKDATMSLRTQGKQTFVDITIDTAGMTFPITVDPTTTITVNGTTNAKYHDLQVNLTTVSLGSSTNNYMRVSDSNNGWDTYLTWFDVSSISGSVTSASVNFQVESYNNTTADNLIIGQITEDWDATKGQYFHNGTWTALSTNANNTTHAANALPASTKVGSINVENVAAGSVTITGAVQNWIQHGQPNYGLEFYMDTTVVSGGNTFAYAMLYTSGSGSSAPTLTVNYNFPPGAPTVTAPNGGESVNTTYNITWTASENNAPQTSSYFGWTSGGNSGSVMTQNTSGAVPKVAQVFTAPSGIGGLFGVKLYIANNASSASSMQVDIYSVSGGVPSTKLNKTTPTINLNPSAQYNTYEADFPDGVPLVPGNQYAVVLTNTSGASNGIIVGTLTTSPSAQFGTLYQQQYGSSSWQSLSGNYMMVEVLTSAPNSSLTYQIDLSQDNGSTWKNIVSQTAAGATSYNYDFTNTPQSSTNLIRVRAYDGTSYGPYDQSNGVFTIQHDQAPTAPTNLSPANNGAVDHTQPISASWQYNDPDTGDSQSKFDIKWSTNNGLTWTEVDGTVTPTTSYTWPANTFSDGQTVQWMVRTYDTNGFSSPWSAQAQFLAGTVPGIPTITSPANNATVAVSNPTVQWSSSGQTDYQLQVQNTSGSVLWDSGDVVSTNVATTLNQYNLANGTSYKLALRVKNAQGLWSAWTTNTINVSYTPPAPATTTASPDNLNARIALSIVDPAPTGSQPTVTSHDIKRRNTGTTSWTRIATNVPAGTWEDYGVASGQAYDYLITSYGANGTQTDSTVISGVSVGQLRGLWIHDVTDPAGTCLHLPYMIASNGDGTTQNSSQVQLQATTVQFAGRPLPNVMFGESYTFSLTKGKVYIPDDGVTWPALESLIRVNKSTFCFRDGRGRILFGNILGYNPTDMTDGVLVDLVLQQTSYSMAV